MIISFFAGVITSIIISIPPMGPIAFAMISRGLNNEIKEAKAIASGASFIDFVYCLIAFGGIGLIISFLPDIASEFYTNNAYLIGIILTFAGCAVVILYGIKILKAKVTIDKLDDKESKVYTTSVERAHRLCEKGKLLAKRFNKKREEKNSNMVGLFFTGVLFCLSSLTIPASWIAIVGFLKGFDFLDSSFWGAFLFSIGAFTGTMIWLIFFTKFISYNKDKFSHATIRKINLIAGVILLLLGVVLFIKAVVSVLSIL